MRICVPPYGVFKSRSCPWQLRTRQCTTRSTWGESHLEKRSCQLFYYCVHMAEKTTPLCYVSFYVRCSVFHLGYVSLYVRCSVLDLPTRGSRVLCTCTADIVFSACSPRIRVRMCMREELPSLELLLACMSCFGYFVSWPGLFRFGAAETSFRGILLNDR